MIPFRRGPRSPKRNAAAIYQAGLAAYEAGNFLEAIDLLSSIADDPSLPGTLARFYLSQAQMHQGIHDLRTGRHRQAADHFTAARRVNPDSAGLSRYLAACHVGNRKFDLAVAEYERTRAAGEADDTLPIRLAHAFARDGRMTQAIETLDQAIRKQPGRDDLRLQLGLLHASVEEYDDAIEALQEAADLAPLNAETQQHLGLAYGATNQPELAIDHLALAQRLRPHDAHVALLLTMALCAAHSRGHNISISPAVAQEAPADDGAIDILGKAIIEDPDFVQAFLRLPESDVDHEVFAMLSNILERALERHPDYADLYHHCSQVYQRLGRTEDAIFAANEAITINPRYVQALIQIAQLYAETDRRIEAMERLERAIEHGGDYPDVHFMLGQLYRMDGKTKQARMEFNRALALNSGYGKAKEALEELATA